MNEKSSEKIKHLIRENKESELSEKLLLESLREHEILDLESFVAQSIQASKDSQALSWTDLFPELANRSPEDAMVELLFGSKAQSNARNLTHNQPKLPFVLSGKHYKPSEISSFNGKLLHYVWEPNTIGNGFLKAITDPDEYRTFLASASEQSSTDFIPRHHVPGAGHTFYQHINYGGHALSLSYRHAWPDLTKVRMSGWWFWTTSWNDQISSLRTGSGSVILGEHIMAPYLTGATMTVRRHTSIPWIGHAWNDRISAILG